MIGIVAFLVPMSINWHNASKVQEVIEQFNDDITLVEADEKSPLDMLLEASLQYNEALFSGGEQRIKDIFEFTGESIDLREYGFENNMFGYINIPKINITLGIYLGASIDNMNMGAVHLDQTSLPIGGQSTNAVIAGHRGNGRYGDMFRNIQKLDYDDYVYITNPWEQLTYKVVDIFTIDPKDIDKILVQEGKDMITLVSCHPYGSSKYRYIIYCERVY